MNSNPLKDGALTHDFIGTGTVTLEMVQKRAAELAVINGRSKHEPSKSDLAEARRELTGAQAVEEKDVILESAPESERWNPIPGSTGGKSRVAPGDDEDEEGRSDSQKLVEEGVAEAEHDQMREASKLKP